MPATAPPFPVHQELAGWELYWARLEVAEGGPAAISAIAALAALRRQVAERARAAWRLDALSAHPTVAALRRLFKAAGCDPSRYRPSSESLLRRVLKGEELPAIHPLVDLNNCLSVDLLVPSCVLAEGTFAPPVALRAGRPGEAYDSLRGPFDLAGKPLLADPAGPFGTPITDSQRVKVQDGTRRAWLVAYLPQGVVDPTEAHRRLTELVAQAPVARRGE
jgi:DNA/RNA-binding domain of Phe-tRNA-synthetase-like protein